VDRTLLTIEHKLDTARGLIHRAALEAETLRDQSLADDLHELHAELQMRLLPAIRAGKITGPIVRSRT